MLCNLQLKLFVPTLLRRMHEFPHSSSVHHQPKTNTFLGIIIPYPNNTIKMYWTQLLFHQPFISIPPAGRVLYVCNYVHPHCRQTRSRNSDLEKDRRGAKRIPDVQTIHTLSIRSSFLSSTDNQTKHRSCLVLPMGTPPILHMAGDRCAMLAMLIR